MSLESAAPVTRTSLPRPRIWVLTNLPSPYQVELLSAVADGRRVDVDVRFFRSPSSGWEPQARFPFRVMWSTPSPFAGDELRLHPRAVWEALTGRHDVFILSGVYTSPTFLLCAILLTLRGKPWCLWWERPRPDASTAAWRSGWTVSGIVRGAKDSVRNWLLRRASRVFGIGTAATSAYEALGVPQSKLRVLPYCCDVTRYDTVDSTQITALRQQLDLTDRTVCLFSGQMIERKGVDVLLAAFARVAVDHPSAVLLLLGAGPLRLQYEQSVSADLRSRVRFLGHRPHAELPVLFRAADLFVFPSRHDGWAVVINEACAARLPIIATRQTGAVTDLVIDGESGRIVERDDVEGTAAALRELIGSPDQRRQFGSRSRALVESWSPQAGAARLADYVYELVTG